MSGIYSPGYSSTENLHVLTPDQLDVAYHSALQSTGNGRMPSDQMSAFVLEFLRHDAERTNRTLRILTWAMATMTAAITIMTAVILIVTVVHQ
jgi:hypothetical protein